MKRKNKSKERPVKVIRLWTLSQAEKALPYVRSIASSLREHWLESLSRRQEVRHLASKPGRPDRTAIISQANAAQEQERADDRFAAALQELMDIDVYLLDPVQGSAFIPFNKDNELAWFVFDLFNEDGLQSWRLHRDELDKRRPIADVTLPVPPPPPTAGADVQLV